MIRSSRSWFSHAGTRATPHAARCRAPSTVQLRTDDQDSFALMERQLREREEHLIEGARRERPKPSSAAVCSSWRSSNAGLRRSPRIATRTAAGVMRSRRGSTPRPARGCRLRGTTLDARRHLAPKHAYLTGLFASTAALVVSADRLALIVDSRYLATAGGRARARRTRHVHVPTSGSHDECLAAEVRASPTAALFEQPTCPSGTTKIWSALAAANTRRHAPTDGWWKPGAQSRTTGARRFGTPAADFRMPLCIIQKA